MRLPWCTRGSPDVPSETSEKDSSDSCVRQAGLLRSAGLSLLISLTLIFSVQT